MLRPGVDEGTFAAGGVQTLRNVHVLEYDLV